MQMIASNSFPFDFVSPSQFPRSRRNIRDIPRISRIDSSSQRPSVLPPSITFIICYHRPSPLFTRFAHLSRRISFLTSFLIRGKCANVQVYTSTTSRREIYVFARGKRIRFRSRISLSPNGTSVLRHRDLTNPLYQQNDRADPAICRPVSLELQPLPWIDRFNPFPNRDTHSSPDISADLFTALPLPAFSPPVDYFTNVFPQISLQIVLHAFPPDYITDLFLDSSVHRCTEFLVDYFPDFFVTSIRRLCYKDFSSGVVESFTLLTGLHFYHFLAASPRTFPRDRCINYRSTDFMNSGRWNTPHDGVQQDFQLSCFGMYLTEPLRIRTRRFLTRF